MKNILSVAIALVALISFNTGIAQNAHFTPQSDVSVTVTCLGQDVYKVCVNGTVYGIGDATTGSLAYTYNETFNCYNKGQDSGPVPGQTGNKSGGVPNFSLTNIRQGHADFSTCFNTVQPKCKGGALSSAVTGITFSKLDLIVAGTTLSLLDYIPNSIPNCDSRQ